MTGVGGRPEVIVEGSYEANRGWKEYNFLYKPGDVSARPPIVGKYSYCCFGETLWDLELSAFFQPTIVDKSWYIISGGDDVSF